LEAIFSQPERIPRGNLGGSRTMTTIPENRKLMYFVMYFLAACVVLALLTSCSPYAAIETNWSQTPTATASMTATAKSSPMGELTATPLPSCTVTAYTLNMRAGAGMQHAVNQILHNGDRLEIIRHAGDWLKIETAQHVTGWIHSHYCK
jgi:uncharacterized protein YgiM (DUF1202 family)